jgi:hypothetical protein
VTVREIADKLVADGLLEYDEYSGDWHVLNAVGDYWSSDVADAVNTAFANELEIGGDAALAMLSVRLRVRELLPAWESQ